MTLFCPTGYTIVHNPALYPTPYLLPQPDLPTSPSPHRGKNKIIMKTGPNFLEGHMYRQDLEQPDIEERDFKSFKRNILQNLPELEQQVERALRQANYIPEFDPDTCRGKRWTDRINAISRYVEAHTANLAGRRTTTPLCRKVQFITNSLISNFGSCVRTDQDIADTKHLRGYHKILSRALVAAKLIIEAEVRIAISTGDGTTPNCVIIAGAYENSQLAAYVHSLAIEMNNLQNRISARMKRLAAAKTAEHRLHTSLANLVTAEAVYSNRGLKCSCKEFDTWTGTLWDRTSFVAGTVDTGCYRNSSRGGFL
ncbi:hypothetical protein TWF281_001536 [Arthrobotrys megalospora]